MKTDVGLLALVLTILMGAAGGAAVGLQGPLASVMSQKVGPVESSFFIHLGGGILSTLLLLVGFQSGNLGMWRSVPWYALAAGVLGVVVIVSVSYTIPRIGIAAAVTLLVAAQLSTGVLLDQFGWLGNVVRPLDPPRFAGLGLLFTGTWLLVR